MLYRVWRADDQSQRQAAADAKEQERLMHEGAVAEAQRLTDEAEGRAAQLRRILSASLTNGSGVSFAAMRRQPEVRPFSPGSLAVPAPRPSWEQFIPAGPPTGIGAMFGRRSRYERELVLAQQRYAEAMSFHDHRESDRLQRLAAARAVHQREAQRLRE